MAECGSCIDREKLMEWPEVEADLKRLVPPFPLAAVDEASRRWGEWAPRFIAEIERIADGGSPFDDDLTETLGRQLASVCDGDLAPLKALAEDRGAAMWCRHGALHAMLVRIVEGDGDRDELLAYLETTCAREAGVMRRGEWDFEREPLDLLTWAADIAADIGPAPLMDKIRGWFDEDLIDPTASGLGHFERQAAKSAEECLAEARDDHNNRYIRDVVAETKWWACFREGDAEDFDDIDHGDPDWLDRIMPAVGGPEFIHSEGTFVRETPKVGRNDPCPCGSGKKFKKCCGREGGVAEAEADDGAGAVRRSIDWLAVRHGEAMRDALHDMLTDGLDEEDEDALADLEGGVWQTIQANALECLLAEGWIWGGDKDLRVSALLLGPSGPPLAAGQRRWIGQLATSPLRLYDITEVVPGVRMTLCDALDPDAAPVVVAEKSGSRAARVGMKLAARIVAVGDRHELSGAVYPFSALYVPALVAELRQDTEDLAEEYSDDLPEAISETIRRHWLMQYLRPAPLPTVVDTHSGDIMLFVTDRYRVRDWDALAWALASQADIDGDRDSGWSRILECEDGLIRRRAAIERGSEPDTVGVSYRTQRYADEGRPWFEDLAAAAVEFLGRDIKDPKVSMMLGAAGARPQPTQSPPNLPPEVLAEAMEQVLLRTYARWADEPIPALENRTPRQAIGTPGGLERVKGLLRSYAADEERMAAEQGRREISFDFLWESLGLRRA